MASRKKKGLDRPEKTGSGSGLGRGLFAARLIVEKKRKKRSLTLPSKEGWVEISKREVLENRAKALSSLWSKREVRRANRGQKNGKKGGRNGDKTFGGGKKGPQRGGGSCGRSLACRHPS